MSDLLPLHQMGCCGPVEAPHTAEEADAISEDFHVFASPVRVQILSALARSADAVCVCDLEAAVPVKQATVSYHLKLLREAGLVRSERHGTWAFYALDHDELARRRARLAGHLQRWETQHVEYTGD